MITLGEYPVDYVLNLQHSGQSKLQIDSEYGTFKIRTNSLRLQTFRRSLKCVTCHRVGVIFLLQTHIINASKTLNCLIDNCNMCFKHLGNRKPIGEIEPPHFNMFHLGPNGVKTLMTRDHIIPRSKGGPDTLDNSQTMCRICNGAKSDQMPEEFEKNGFKRRPLK